MRHGALITLGEALQQMRQCAPYKHKLAEATLACAWKAAMPKAVRIRTERVFYKQDKLFVQLSSAPLRQELRLNKDKVIALVSAHAQGCPFTDLVFL